MSRFADYRIFLFPYEMYAAQYIMKNTAECGGANLDTNDNKNIFTRTHDAFSRKSARDDLRLSSVAIKKKKKKREKQITPTPISGRTRARNFED